MNITRPQFLQRIENCVQGSIPYAAAKFSISDQYLFYYPIAKKNLSNKRQLLAYEAHLKFHGLKQSGVFPVNASFLPRYNEFYAAHLRNIDCIGLHQLQMERELIEYWKLESDFISHEEQEPDRSCPVLERNCYLFSFAGKRVAIIAPFAEILCQRGTTQIFEAVWAKTGKKWFHPAALIPVEFPYAVEHETQNRFSDVIDLFENVSASLRNLNYDVALIAAGGLGVPFASFVKQQGKIAISLGGHLQVLFGVVGKRWREREDWRENYFTDAWIDMPKQYRPKTVGVCDQGAYW